MPPRFFVVCNNLKDQQGHYFETSVSVAKAARKAGFRPIVATHVDCRPDLFPDWLDIYPILCTDHWMHEGPARDRDFEGLLPTPYLEIGEVNAGRASISDYIEARFASEQRYKCRKCRRSLAFLGPWFLYCCRRMLSFLPRFLRRPLRGLLDQVAPTAKRFLKSPTVKRWVTRIVGRLWRRTVCTCTGPLSRSLQHPIERPYVDKAMRTLMPEKLDRELESALTFKRDLERLFSITGVSSEDHVLMGTAHERELLAIQLFVKRMGEGRAPLFHLEFRHPLFRGEVDEAQIQKLKPLRHKRLLFDLYRSQTPSRRIRFYTDTAELAEEYSLLSRFPFDVLPIPFRAHLIDDGEDGPQRPLRIVYLGDARDEKGFHWLPRLIDELMQEYVSSGRVRFILQATESVPEYNPRSVRALERLKEYDSSTVTLEGVDGPLSPEEYYELVAEADIVLLPYDKLRYRSASSGTFTEAFAAGKPCVVPCNTWMSSMLPPGAGEVFTDESSFIQNVKRLVDNYERYRRTAGRYSAQWLAKHSPEALVSCLLTASERHGECEPAARSA